MVNAWWWLLVVHIFNYLRNMLKAQYWDAALTPDGWSQEQRRGAPGWAHSSTAGTTQLPAPPAQMTHMPLTSFSKHPNILHILYQWQLPYFKEWCFFFSFFFSDTEETKNTGVSALNSFAYFRTEYRSNLVDTKHISGMTTLFQSPCFIFKMGFEVAAQTCSQSYSIGCPAHSTNISLTSTGAISCYLSPSSIPLKSFGEVLTQACSTNGMGEDKQSPWSLKATISVSWPSTEFAWPLHGSLATLSMCFVCSSSR